MLMVCPMTPVEPTTTSSGAIPSCSAAARAILSAFSPLCSQQALALPLLATTAWAAPFCSAWRVHSTEAALTTFCVYMPQAAQGFSEKSSIKSFLSALLLAFTPACTPAAVNPFGAHTPPEVQFNILIPSFLSSSHRAEWFSPYRRVTLPYQQCTAGAHRFNPVVSSSPSIRFMFCTAAPEAPFPRLSNRAVIST